MSATRRPGREYLSAQHEGNPATWFGGGWRWFFWPDATERARRTHLVLVASLAAYLALQPTTEMTLARSLFFATTVFCGLLLPVLGSAARRYAAIPAPPWLLTVALATFFFWATLSWAWSIEPAYTAGQLKREVLDNVVLIGCAYLAARDAPSLRVLCGGALAGILVLAVATFVLEALGVGWQMGRWQLGVGPWATALVLTAPLLLLLPAGPPLGLVRPRRGALVALVYLVLMLANAWMCESRMVWIALGVAVLVAGSAAAYRWPLAFVRARRGWLAIAVLVILALIVAFIATVRDRTVAQHAPGTTVESVLLHDPRVALWDRTMESVRERPWIGYGFGREVLGDRFAVELHNPMLVHAHNLYLSLLLQIGAIGLAAYGLVLLTLIHTHLRFLRAPDDVLAQVGVVGLAIVAGWVTKNLTDDFFFRSNAKEFWLLQAMLVGYGMRRLARPP